MNYSKTKINDQFPFDQLECQFYNVCKFFDYKTCQYDKPCLYSIGVIQDGKMALVNVRYLLRKSLEEYVVNEALKFQIKQINKDK